MSGQVQAKKIAYLCSGGSMGGSQRQLLYLIERLDRRAYEPVIVCRQEGVFTDALRELGVRSLVRSMRAWRKFPAAFFRYVDAEKLVRSLRKEGISLVHSSDIWLSGYMRWISRRIGIPSVIHIRAPVGPRDVRKHRLDRADVSIAISARVRQNLIEAGIDAEKIVQIDDGVDTELFRPSSNSDVLGRDFPASEGIRVGIVGRVVESKRQIEFLRAAEVIRGTVAKKVYFFIIGRCDRNDYYKALQKLISSNGLKDRVFFTGQRNDMPNVLCSLDILVSLSGGSVMFEAMSCGRAVISAAFTSVRDAVHLQDGKTGLLVPSRSVADLAGAIKRLIEDESLRVRLGCQGREWTVNNLTCQKMARKTQDVYQRILEDNRFSL
jgi:glycosyltransferase involved in cell wall biosynthesis